MFYFGQCLSGYFLGTDASLMQNFHDRRNIFFQFFSSCLDWGKILHQYTVKEFLYFYIPQTATGVVVFQFLKILIFRKVFCKIVIIAEGIQIDKYA